jgi:adenylate kinase family enzyme
MRILVTGASGSGTTTLAGVLASHLQWRHLDLDDYYWLPTSPPFREKRDPQSRLSSCLRDLRARPDAVVSGSLVGWGAELEDAFDLVVFLYLDAGIRVERLRRRELERYGMTDPAFLEWASQYDVGPPEGRSLAKHQAWLAVRKCPVLRLEGDLPVGERMRRVLAAAGLPTHRHS